MLLFHAVHLSKRNLLYHGNGFHALITGLKTMDFLRAAMLIKQLINLLKSFSLLLQSHNGRALIQEWNTVERS